MKQQALSALDTLQLSIFPRRLFYLKKTGTKVWFCGPSKRTVPSTYNCFCTHGIHIKGSARSIDGVHIRLSKLPNNILSWWAILVDISRFDDT